MSLPVVSVLKTVVASKAFKEILRVVLALLAGYAGSGCGVVLPANSAQLDTFECQVAALEDADVPLAAAEDLVMALRAQNFEYAVKQLLRLGVTVEAIEGIAEAYNACSEPVALEPRPDISEQPIPPDGVLRIEAN